MKARTIIVLLSILICLSGFLGCSTPKNLTSSTKETNALEEKRSELTAGDIRTYIDTTKKAGLEITYTKVEFYPPEEMPAGPGPEANEKANTNSQVTPEVKKPPDKGAIKSIEQLTITSTQEEAGITETQETNTSEKEEEIKSDNSIETDTEEETAEDPYKWRYILGILVASIIIGTVGFFFLRKTKVFHFIKKLFK